MITYVPDMPPSSVSNNQLFAEWCSLACHRMLISRCGTCSVMPHGLCASWHVIKSGLHHQQCRAEPDTHRVAGLPSSSNHPEQLSPAVQVANVAAPAVLAVYVLNTNISFIDATVAVLGWRLAETSEGQVNSFEVSPPMASQPSLKCAAREALNVHQQAASESIPTMSLVLSASSLTCLPF